MATGPAQVSGTVNFGDNGWPSARIIDIPDWREDDSLLVKVLKIERYHYRRRYEELCIERDGLQQAVKEKGALPESL